MEKIHFLNGGQRVDGTLVTPTDTQGKKPGVVFFHGMTSSEKNYIPIAEQLARNGIVGMTLSLRGHGTSEGNFNMLTVNDALADGLAAYDFFARYDFIDRNRIGLCGTSVGAAIATIVSTQRKVESLVLRVPATYSDGMMQMTFKQIMTEEKQIFSKVSNINSTAALKAVRQFTGDLLIITSERDHVIPVAIPTAYFTNASSARKKEMTQIQDATHNLTDENWREQFVERTVKWFTENL